MKDIIVVLRYALKYKKYGAINLVLNLFSTVFALFSFTLIIPFLQILFKQADLVTQYQGFEFSTKSIAYNFNYYLSKIIIEQGELNALIAVSLIMITSTLLKTLLSYLAGYFMAPVMNGTVRDFQNKIYDKILELPLSYFSDEKKGDIMSRASVDIQEIKFTVTSFLDVVVKDPITIIFFLIFLIFTSPSLTMFVIIFIPVIGFLIGKIGKSLKRSSMKGQIKSGEILSTIEETLGGLRIIKAFNAESFVKQRYYILVDALYKIMNKVTRRNSLSTPVSEFLGTTVIVIIIIFGGSLVLGQESSLTGSQFITYIVVFSQILTPAKSLSKAYYSVKKGAASIERVNHVLNAKNNITQVANPKHIHEFNSKIEFRNVSFKYSENYVLKNINLTIEKGKTVALVGQSGSGKSTLVDLLSRFYDISEGEILIDGENIKDLYIKDLRSLMGNVNQEAILFNNSIFDNIAFGSEIAEEEKIMNAAKVANAHDFIMETENLYQTNIGDRGNKLSGGQRQRLSIARAVLKNPPILILDEATSALDTESEKLVQDALDNLMKNRTSIVIAHRLSTVKNADLICVMRAGEIIERGVHEELIKLNGNYKNLHDLQMF